MSRWRSRVDFVAALAMIVTAGVVIWAAWTRPEPPPTPVQIDHPTPPLEVLPSEPVAFAGAYVKGPATAKVAILEFADLQCPACAVFAKQTFGALVAKYIDPGRVQFGFRHFPIPNHPFAMPAAIAAQCADEQGQFWAMYEALYGVAPKLDDAALQSTAKSLGLDQPRWSACLKADEAAAAVRRDVDEGRRLKLRGTPTFLIGTIGNDGRLRATARLYGAHPLVDFEAAIQQAEAGTPHAK